MQTSSRIWAGIGKGIGTEFGLGSPFWMEWDGL